MDNIETLFIGAVIGLLTGLAWDKKRSSQHLIINKLNYIMATQAELAQQLRDLTAQNEKARTEILAKIADLETALANAGNTTPEVDDALAALKASVQTDDDIVADTEA